MAKKPNNTVDVILSAMRKRLKSADSAKSFRERYLDDDDGVAGWVRTGIWSIDWLYGNFAGIPLGRGSVLWGGEGSGKSALALTILKAVQKQGGVGIWLDYDQAFDPLYARNAKIDEERMLMPQADSIEQGLDVMHDSIQAVYGGLVKGKSKDANAQTVPLLFVWDSLAAAAPEALLEAKSAEERQVARTAGVLSSQLMKLRIYQRDKAIHTLFLNEQRDNFNAVGFGAPQTRMPHGKALRHYSTTTIQTTRIKTLKHTASGREIVDGFIIQMRADKSRKGVSFRKANVFLSASKTNGGVKVVQSNYMFLHDANLLVPAGANGVKIKGVPEAGTFAEKEFGGVLKEYRKPIEAMLKDQMSDGSPVNTDVAPGTEHVTE